MICVALFALCGLSSCNYNSLVEKQQGVDQAWAEVENQYQRRSDLIPNLVNTVKGYSTHEEATLTKVTEARAKATSITINPEDLNEETLAKYQAAQNELSGALKSLLAVTEAYPALTPGELRLSCLLSIGLDNKQISRLLSIQPDSVKKARQRLRAKLGYRRTSRSTPSSPDSEHARHANCMSNFAESKKIINFAL